VLFQCGDGLLPEPPGKNSVPSRPSFDGQRGVAFNLMVTRRFVFIDALRGIASLGVVLFHAVASSFGSSSSRFVIIGQRSCGSRVPRQVPAGAGNDPGGEAYPCWGAFESLTPPPWMLGRQSPSARVARAPSIWRSCIKAMLAAAANARGRSSR
jgi:hypothetical protein